MTISIYIFVVNEQVLCNRYGTSLDCVTNCDVEFSFVIVFSSKWILKVLKSIYFIPLEVVRMAKGEEEAI